MGPGVFRPLMGLYEMVLTTSEACTLYPLLGVRTFYNQLFANALTLTLRPENTSAQGQSNEAAHRGGDLPGGDAPCQGASRDYPVLTSHLMACVLLSKCTPNVCVNEYVAVASAPVLLVFRAR
eukprot:7531095-Pyramimonas_sp.AAC.1